jgi:AraC family transcriptional activator of tynA and feaB
MDSQSDYQRDVGPGAGPWDGTAGRRPGFATVSAADEVVRPSTRGQSELTASRWLQLLQEHVFDAQRWRCGDQAPRVAVQDERSFRARLRSGRLGAQRFCHIDVTPHVLEARNNRPSWIDDHMVVLQLTGVSVVSAGSCTMRLRPGSILLIGDPASLRIEHESDVEQLLLLQPLTQDDLVGLPAQALTLCEANAGMERMVQRWIIDACLHGQFDGRDLMNDVAQILSRLLGQVLRGSRASPRDVVSGGLARERIEDFIAKHLNDPGLSALSLAKAFGCSVRTLHRAFKRSDGETLARHIWRRRVEVCAEALRAPDSASLSLTELAYRWGFASSTHFATLFRESYGDSPSGYRRKHLCV